MKRKSPWGIVPVIYILFSCLFFGLYLDSIEAFPQLRDPQAAEQRRLAREARKAEKEAARLAKEEARKAEEAARRQNDERLNPVSLEAVAPIIDFLPIIVFKCHGNDGKQKPVGSLRLRIF